MKIWLLQIPRLDDHYSWGIKEIENVLVELNQNVELVEINHEIYKQFFSSEYWPAIESYGIVGKSNLPINLISNCIQKLLNPIKDGDIVLSAVFSTESRSWFTLIHAMLRKKFGKKIILGAGGQGVRSPGESGLDSEWSDWILQIGLADIVFLGQAVHTIKDWVKNNFTGRGKQYFQNKNFPNLGFIKSTVLQEPHKRIKDVLGYWTHDVNEHEILDIREDRKDVVIHFTQGCVKKCTFCDVWRITPEFVIKDPSSVINEIDYYNKNTDMNHLLFVDNTINSSNSAFLKFLDLLYSWQQKNNRQDITWSAQFAIKPINQQKDEMFELVAKTNGNLSIGFDHASNSILTQMKKLYQWHDVEYFISKCNQFGTPIHRAIWLVGYPTETEQDFREYQKLINLNSKPNTILCHHVLPVNINKGSELENLVTIDQSRPNDWFNNLVNKQVRLERKNYLDHSLFKQGSNYLKHRVSVERARR